MRALATIVVLLVAAVPLGLAPATAAGAPTCFGKPATKVMKPGEGTYTGTTGDDVVVGSNGADVIRFASTSGIDLVCGNAGNDDILVKGASDKADGGAGNDFVAATNGATALGGAGDDVVSASDFGSRAEGGSGNDDVKVIVGATGDGGSGNDYVHGGSGGVIDVAMFGGSGNDRLENDNIGDPILDCGSGTDTVVPGDSTQVRQCEKVQQ